MGWHALTDDYIQAMCGRVIQSSGPLRYAIVDGMNVRDSHVHNYPPSILRFHAAWIFFWTCRRDEMIAKGAINPRE
jgi:hypothetical protein